MISTIQRMLCFRSLAVKLSLLCSLLLVLIVSCAEGATLDGVILDDGSPLSGVTINLYSLDEVRQTKLMKEVGLPSKLYPPDRMIKAGGYRFIKPVVRVVQVDLDKDNRVNVTIQAKSDQHYCGETNPVIRYETREGTSINMSGEVWHIEDNSSPRRPFGGVRVLLYSMSGKQEALTKSGADGHFSLRVPQPGKYRLKAACRGYRLQAATIWITRNNTTIVSIGMPPNGYEPICQ